MPQKGLSMRKIKEVLRLHSQGLAQRQIARSCSISQSTVSAYVKAAEATGIRFADVADWEDTRLASALLPAPVAPPTSDRHLVPDFAAMRAELQRHKHLTLMLLWEEYRERHPDGYGYSRFCELYQRWRGKQEVVLRQEHRAGEKVFVDYAGQTIPVQDSGTGEIQQAQLFVAVLGASSYTYAEATWTQGLADWIDTQIGDPTIADSILDRLVHNAHRESVSRKWRKTMVEPVQPPPPCPAPHSPLRAEIQAERLTDADHFRIMKQASVASLRCDRHRRNTQTSSSRRTSR